MLKNHETALNPNQDPFHLLDHISDGLIFVDHDWIVQYCNAEAENILKVTKMKMKGESFWKCFPGFNDQKFSSRFHRALKLQQAFQFEEYYQPLQLWVEVGLHPLQNGLSIYFKNINFQKQQEYRLQEMNERYNRIMGFISEAIWEWDMGAATAAWHGDNLAKLLDYDEPDRGSVNFWEKNVHPDDIERVKQHFQAAVQGKQNYYSQQYRLKKKNGDFIYVRDRAQIIRNGKGHCIKVIGVTDDITVQKLYESALIEGKESYRLLFDQAPLPQWIYDLKTLRFLDVNAAAIEKYGYSYKEFLEMTLFDIRPQEDCPKVLEAVKSREQEGVVHQGIWTHIKKNGERISVEISLTSLHYNGQKAQLSTINDVTEKLSFQEQLANERLLRQKSILKAVIEAQEKERTELGMELHDNVNQIITTAKLYIENSRLNPGQREESTQKAMELLGLAINEIRKLSKGLVTPGIHGSDFTEALTEMIRYYQDLNLFCIDYISEPTIDCLQGEIKLTLYRIIQEQLNNIVKYAKASRVKVHILFKDGGFLIRVEDNGIGFNTDQKKSGLGLGNIKNRAELFDGKFKIISAAGKGCTMEVEFPKEFLLQQECDQ
jgi:PAS domain S-box-containing protein